MFFLFLIDEYTDVESGPNVQKIVNIIIDALENPGKPRPKDENILGEVARQYVLYYFREKWDKLINIPDSG